MKLESTAVSRQRRPSEALSRPMPVHENATITIESTTPGTADEPEVDPEDEDADDERERGHDGTVRDRGKRAAEEERNAVRGRDDERGQREREPLLGDRLRHREEARHGGRDERVADDEEGVVLDVGRPPEEDEEDHLRDGRDQQHHHEQRGLQPGEERPVAEPAADREDAQRLHVSPSVARSRARRRNAFSSSPPSTA